MTVGTAPLFRGDGFFVNYRTSEGGLEALPLGPPWGLGPRRQFYLFRLRHQQRVKYQGRHPYIVVQKTSAAQRQREWRYAVGVESPRPAKQILPTRLKNRRRE